MGLETGTYISDLNPSWPVDATDVVSEGDDHIRLTKAVLLNSWPGVTGAVTLTHTQLNQAAIKNEANTFTQAVTVQGAFTSLGIDDNATQEVFELSNSAALVRAGGLGMRDTLNPLFSQQSTAEGIAALGEYRILDNSNNILVQVGLLSGSNNDLTLRARDASGDIVFAAGGTTERMRIGSNGDVTIATRIGVGGAADANAGMTVHGGTSRLIIRSAAANTARLHFENADQGIVAGVLAQFNRLAFTPHGNVGDIRFGGMDISPSSVVFGGDFQTTDLDVIGSVTTNGNLTASQIVSSAGGVIKADNAGTMALSAGVNTSQGANIVLYGNAAASRPNDIRLRNDTQDKLYFSNSANKWVFPGPDVTGIVGGVGIASGEGRFEVVSALPGTPDANTVYFVV